jgi:hypothetical protein
MAIHGEWGEGSALTFAGDPTRPWAENEKNIRKVEESF